MNLILCILVGTGAYKAASQEIFKTLAIVSTENKRDARVYSTVKMSQTKSNSCEILEAARCRRSAVWCIKDKEPPDSSGQPAYYERYHDGN